MTPPPKSTPVHHTQEYISLRDHFQDLLDNQRDYFLARLDAMNQATESARVTMNDRLDGMNEIRNTLRDQNRTFVARLEYDGFKENTNKDITDLKLSRAETEGKASQTSVLVTMLISLISLALGIIKLLSP